MNLARGSNIVNMLAYHLVLQFCLQFDAQSPLAAYSKINEFAIFLSSKRIGMQE